MSRPRHTGRNPSAKQLREADRIAALRPLRQRSHPRALAADPRKLQHVNTYGSLPEYYVDRPFVCRNCGRREIWLARDQKWYYEEAKGHMDARAVECHACRAAKKSPGKSRKEKKP